MHSISTMGLHEMYDEFYGDQAILGNETQIMLITKWFDAIVSPSANHDKMGPVLMISGGCGVGKSRIVNIMAKRNNFLVKYSYALDNRNATHVNQLVKEYEHVEMEVINNDYVVTKKRVMVILEDMDSDTSFAMTTLADHIKKVKKQPIHQCVPIILICNNPLESKFSCIFPKLVEHANMKKLCNTHLHVIYNRIIYPEFSKRYFQSNKTTSLLELSDLNDLIFQSNGDARHFLNQLQFRIYSSQTSNKNISKSMQHSIKQNTQLNMTQRVQNVHNLWDIFDNILNRDIDIDSIIYLVNMESNWVVNGLWENYLSREFIHSNIHDISNISEMYSLTNCTFEPNLVTKSYIDFSIMQPFVHILSTYSMRHFIMNTICPPNVDTNRFRFPSYFAKISNHRILRNANANILTNITSSINCIYTPSEFNYIVIQPIIEIIERISDISFDNDLNIIATILHKYNISIDDLFTILRPHIFGMHDDRYRINQNMKASLRRNLQVTHSN